jgi:hypothetical protein
MKSSLFDARAELITNACGVRYLAAIAMGCCVVAFPQVYINLDLNISEGILNKAQVTMRFLRIYGSILAIANIH